MPYEQVINTTVTGQQQMQAAVGSTDRLSESTKKMNDALYGASAATEKMTLAQAKLAAEEAKLEQLREKHRIQTEAFANSVSKAAASQDQLTAGTVRATGGVREMTNALRVMEGGMPIRAAAQFLTSIQGFGPAVSAAFPIIGAIALFGVVEKIGDKLGLHLSIWKDIEATQKASTEELRTSGKEYDTLIHKIKQVQDARFRLTHGDVAALGKESFESAQKAAVGDRKHVQDLETQLAAVQKLRQPGLSGGLTEDEFRAATFAGVTGIERNPNSGLYFASAFGSHQATINRALTNLPGEISGAKAQRQYDEETAGYLRDQQDQAIDRENEKKQREAEAAQRKAEQARRKAEADENRRAEDRKRAQEELAAASPNRGVNDRMNAAYGKLQLEYRDALRRDPAHADDVNQNYSARFAALAITSGRNASESVEKSSTLMDESGSMLEAFIKKFDAALKTVITDVEGNPALHGMLGQVSVPTAPDDYRSAREQLRSAQRTGQRNIGLFGASARLQGLDQGSIEAGSYGIRQQTIQAEYDAELRLADLKKTEEERTQARADALAKKDDELFEARLAHEQAIIEIATRQKEEFQNFAVGLFGAARSGNVGGFIRGQANSLADKVVGNAAGMAWPAIAGLIPHAGDPDSTVGKLLQGTPFGADPLKTAGKTLDDAGNKLIAAALLLAKAGGGNIGSSGTGLGSLASSIPGLDVFGSDVGGWTGGGGVGGSGGGAAGLSALQLAGITPNSAKYVSPLAKDIGYGALIAGGGFAAYSGFKAGGAQGVSQGIGAIAGTAAALDPEPISKAILMGVSIGTGIFSSIFGDPKQRESARIANELKYNQYMAPVSINASMTTGGTFADFDRFGSPRGSGLSPFPNISQGYFDYSHNTVVPGRTNSQFGGDIHLHVNALDTRNIIDRSGDIADALVHAMDTGRATSFQERLRN